MSPGELKARAEARLAPLLLHAAENVPFYRESYRCLGLGPDELRTIEDLQMLPVVSKATYREHPTEHFLAVNIPAYRHIQRSTSGSSGEPFRFWLDRNKLPLIVATRLFYDSWFGPSLFDRCVRIGVPPAAKPRLPPCPALSARAGPPKPSVPAGCSGRWL